MQHRIFSAKYKFIQEIINGINYLEKGRVGGGKKISELVSSVFHLFFFCFFETNEGDSLQREKEQRGQPQVAWPGQTRDRRGQNAELTYKSFEE